MMVTQLIIITHTAQDLLGVVVEFSTGLLEYFRVELPTCHWGKTENVLDITIGFFARPRALETLGRMDMKV